MSENEFLPKESNANDEIFRQRISTENVAEIRQLLAIGAVELIHVAVVWPPPKGKSVEAHARARREHRFPPGLTAQATRMTEAILSEDPSVLVLLRTAREVTGQFRRLTRLSPG